MFALPAAPLYVPVPFPVPVIGHMPSTLLHASCGAVELPAPGSSMRRNASDQGGDRRRLVAGVLKKIVKLTCGTVLPAAVGTPPVQSSSRSPTTSVRLSARSSDGTAAFATHVKGIWADAV